MPRLLKPFAALAVAACLALTACGERTTSEDPPGEETAASESIYRNGIIGDDPRADDEPERGGTLTHAMFLEPGSLDPARTIAAGTTGGMEMLAVYDSLTALDPETQTFIPRMAESFDPNDDFTTWTVKLREGVTFHDGTPLTADAVIASQQRYVDEKGPEQSLWESNVVGMEATDDLTITYEMNKPWPLFPAILSTGPGMIVAPAAYASGEFTPIGAGPFTFESWAQNEEILLAANPDYWGGEPYLDQIRSVPIPDPVARMDALAADTVDSTFVRTPDTVDPAVESGLGGYMSITSSSYTYVINGEAGRPGADPRIRKAIALAYDHEAVYQRGYEGLGIGLATPDVFGPVSKWHGDVGGIEQNLEEARALLDEAKADGYDGKITVLDNQSSDRRKVALATQAMLENVGFEVENESLRTAAETIVKVSNKDYDIANTSLNVRDYDPHSRLHAFLHSTGNQRHGMPTSPEMDALLEELQGASTDDDRQRLFDELQTLVNEEVPLVSAGAAAELVAWDNDVHGVVGTTTSMWFLDKAWIG